MFLNSSWSCFFFIFVIFFFVAVLDAESPYKYFDWTITSGMISPIGVSQEVILINGEFPGPYIYAVTNDNLVVNIHNNLLEPFLITWSGVQQRKNSWEDGVFGTTCPIPPGRNFTYNFPVKDQIGSFFYYPSLGFQKASGGFGGFRIKSRPRIPVPFKEHAGDYTVLIGDWYSRNHRVIHFSLDRGRMLPSPDAILINGLGRGAHCMHVSVTGIYYGIVRTVCTFP